MGSRGDPHPGLQDRPERPARLLRAWPPHQELREPPRSDLPPAGGALQEHLGNENARAQVRSGRCGLGADVRACVFWVPDRPSSLPVDRARPDSAPAYTRRTSGNRGVGPELARPGREHRAQTHSLPGTARPPAADERQNRGRCHVSEGVPSHRGVCRVTPGR